MEVKNLRCKDSPGRRSLWCYDCNLDDFCPFSSEGKQVIEDRYKYYKELRKIFKIRRK